MVNEKFLQNFHKHLQKNLKGSLAGQPVVSQGGAAVDHHKGLGHSLAAAVVPFMPSKYEATEFIAGWIPLTDDSMPQLYFQVPALNVKGKYIAGVGQFGCVVSGALPETVVAPRVGMKCMFMPLESVLAVGGHLGAAEAKAAQWGPAIQAMNADKALRKAATPKKIDSYVSGFYVRMDKKSPIGHTQLAPFRGYTVLTAQRVPVPTGFDNRPFFDYREVLSSFSAIAGFLRRHGQGSDSVGKQVVTASNRAMMTALLTHLEGAGG